MMKKKSNKDIEFEISFYEKLLKDDPEFIDALIPLAENYTLMGQFENGLKMDLKLAELKPLDHIIQYNLACSLSLMDKIDASIETLEKAIELGYDDFEHMDNDPDLSHIRSSKNYQTIISKMRH